MIASGEIKYTAELHWADREGGVHTERHVGMDVQTPTTAAFRRAVSLLREGKAVSFTTRHHERRYA